MEFAEKFAPVSAERLVSFNNSAALMVFADHGMRFSLIDNTVGFPLLFDRILYIGQLEN